MTRRLMLVLLVLVPAAAHAGVTATWAVGDGEKVVRPSSLKERNSAWDGRRVTLFAARNEIVAFQLIVEADARGIGALSLRLPELRRKGGGRIAYAAPGADPSRFAGRAISIFTVHDMSVAERSHADWVWPPGGPAEPKGFLGPQPVQLVPENARKGRGGLPIAVAASAVQALWVEIYAARDLPAGTYEGTVTVTADGRKTAVPVVLDVLDFTLPDRNSLDVMVYYEPHQAEMYMGRSFDPEFHRFAHRQRIELVHAYDEEKVRAARGRFDGSDFTRAEGYEGPGEGVGNRIVPRTFYGPGPGWNDRAEAWRRADAWMTFLSSAVPGARTFLYAPDEPRPKQYPEILALGANIHSNPGPGRALPVFVTRSWVAELDEAIDFWCAGPQHFDIARAAKERARGRSYCFYNGGRPNGPALVIDAPATEARAVGWAAFKHGVDLYFYWHGVHWQHNRQKQGERRQDVWSNPITFDNRGQPDKEDFGYINGDGVLLYPGRETIHPAQDRGIDGPVSTVQLANLRRGVQDHLYLTLARGLGLDAVVDEALAAVVPRVFSDAGATVGFAETGEAYEAARRRLADAIVAAQAKGKR
jgi:hypothetical protein